MIFWSLQFVSIMATAVVVKMEAAADDDDSWLYGGSGDCLNWSFSLKARRLCTLDE